MRAGRVGLPGVSPGRLRVETKQLGSDLLANFRAPFPVERCAQEPACGPGIPVERLGRSDRVKNEGLLGIALEGLPEPIVVLRSQPARSEEKAQAVEEAFPTPGGIVGGTGCVQGRVHAAELRLGLRQLEVEASRPGVSVESLPRELRCLLHTSSGEEECAKAHVLFQVRGVRSGGCRLP